MSTRVAWENELKKSVDQMAPIYLLYGTEEFLLKEALLSLVHHAVADDPMGSFRFNGEEASGIAAALAEAETFPFFGERKAVILQDAQFLTPKGKADETVAALESYLKNPSPFTVLILAVYADKLDDRKKITKLVKDKAAVYTFSALKESECKEWIRKRAQHKGLRLDTNSLERLFLSVGNDLRALDSELEKLSLYLGSDANTNSKGILTADEPTVELLVSKTGQNSVFVFVDDVVRGKTKQALESLSDLQKTKEPAVYLVFMLARQFRIMLQVKLQLRRGYSPAQIAGSLNLHPYACKIAAEQGEAYQAKQLEMILVKLADLDFSLKTGRVLEQEAVRDFILWLNVSIQSR